MSPEEMKRGTKDFALRVIRLCSTLQRKPVCDVIGRQLLRSATSVGANYRAACKSRSAAEFAAKIGTVEEEADECAFWLDLLVESNNIDGRRLAALLKEATELTAIAAASRKTVRKGSASKSAIGNRKSAMEQRVS